LWLYKNSEKKWEDKDFWQASCQTHQTCQTCQTMPDGWTFPDALGTAVIVTGENNAYPWPDGKKDRAYVWFAWKSLRGSIRWGNPGKWLKLETEWNEKIKG